MISLRVHDPEGTGHGIVRREVNFCETNKGRARASVYPVA